MEIALLPKNAVKLRGKQATMVVDPVDAATPYQAALFLYGEGRPAGDSVVISGPGEYEIGGIKVSGLKSTEGYSYSLTIDDLDVLVGSLQAISKLQHKLKEHHLVLLLSEQEGDASFATGLATNAILLYGEKANDVLSKFAKDTINTMSKYQVTKEKLPPEMQTILLA
jgi:hypothetical protein